MAPHRHHNKSREVPVTKDNSDTDEEEFIYNEKLRTKPFIVMVSTAAALGGLIFGYDIGGAGMTVPDGVQTDLILSNTCSPLTFILHTYRCNFCHGRVP